jgi:hypothetical protein
MPERASVFYQAPWMMHRRITSRRNQKFAGVLALMISASSWPILRNLCGKVVGK